MENQIKTAYVLADQDAPTMLSVEEMFSMLTEDNKKKINLLIERLITEQS